MRKTEQHPLITVLGVSGDTLGHQGAERLAAADLVVGSETHRALAAAAGREFVSIIPLDGALSRIQETVAAARRVVVLASGDPLFYGIGRKLFGRFGEELVEVVPALSSMQLAFARTKIPWDDARIISLHGRSHPAPEIPLLSYSKVGVFTDRVNRPDRLALAMAERLEEMGLTRLLADYRAWVCERLGMEGERVVAGTLREIAAARFAEPNVLVLLRPPLAGRAVEGFGLCEEEIFHEAGMITKDEIRAAVLHRLRLPESGVFWDVGGGSGSVSVEALRLRPGLMGWIVEQKPERLSWIRENQARFFLFNLTVVQGQAPELLAALPDPDRVFIGGSGGRLDDILRQVAPRLKPGGRVVLTAVSEATRNAARDLLSGAGFKVFASELAVTRWDHHGTQKKLNPVTIFVGEQ